MHYTMINQLPKLEFIDLVSNIGGALSVVIGVSFLSFVELIELVYFSFIIFLKNDHSVSKKIIKD